MHTQLFYCYVKFKVMIIEFCGLSLVLKSFYNKNYIFLGLSTQIDSLE